jgi:D-lyxose ketol-isomerase
MTNKISRRAMLGSAAVGLTAVAANSADAQVVRRSPRRRRLPNYPNAYYYKGGKFDENAAKNAVFDLLEYHGYPIYPTLRENLAVTDFDLGKFTEVGLACVMFANKWGGEFSYMMQDLFLMPNQMLPEHWHIKPENTQEGGAQKDEGWFIRWGRSYVIGEGTPNLPQEVKVPAVHGAVTVEHCTIADPGVFVPLSSVGSHHWQFGGKEGVILTEVANYHNGKMVRFANDTATKAFGN